MNKKPLDIVTSIENALMEDKTTIEMNINQCKEFIRIGNERIEASKGDDDVYGSGFQNLWEKLIVQRTIDLEKWQNHVTQK
jgi:hypothetical protein